MRSALTKIQLLYSFSSASLKQNYFDRTPIGASDFVTYEGVEIDQFFDEITVHNLSDNELHYCIELDSDNSIVVNNTPKDGVKSVPAGYVVREDNIASIQRLRLYLNGSGNVEVALFKNVARRH